MTTPAWPPLARTCATCGAGFNPRSTNQTYCSAACRESAKYQRMREDPERWDAYLARLRSAYVPTGRPRGIEPQTVGCAEPDCEDKHFARGFCRRHYYADRRRRGLDGSKVTEVVSALVKRYDESGNFIAEPVAQRLRCSVGRPLIFPRCPDCGRIMRSILNDLELDLRDCGPCGVRASLNMEEVSWLTSSTPSTEQPRPTPN